MQKRKLGNSGLEVTAITFGCWQAGGDSWTDVNDDSSIATMRAALDAGINFFDTAEGYGNGHSEEVLATALEGKRDEVLIATKTNDLASEKLIAACEKSLKRLQTDHVDLYQIHWPSGTWGGPIIPIGDTMGALLKLKEQGKIRAIGVSNFNAQQIAEALQFGQIDSLQPPYSLLWRAYEDNGTFAACVPNNVGIISYSSIAQGLLSGKFNADNKPGEKDNRSKNLLFQGEHYERALQAVEKLKPIAAKYSTTLAQLATAWVLAQPSMTSAIVGARTPDQITDIAGAAKIQLQDADLQQMETIGREVTDQIPEDRSSMWKWS
jgi:aryl-alcohol dehydrogenase-like predicted oxidoreductase